MKGIEEAMVLLDANIILRYLKEDDVEMADKAEEYIRRGDAFVTTEVIEEVIYVFQKVYSLKRSDISRLLIGFTRLVTVSDPEVIECTLEIFGKTNLDFVDCVLFAYYKLLDFEIATFDKQLIKLMSRADAGEKF
ncbi:MAG: PIN domain-containing protein [Synergistaceae bacterium]|nr:PIN domain-containing protein [Synergistaceae bacterium]